MTVQWNRQESTHLIAAPFLADAWHLAENLRSSRKALLRRRDVTVAASDASFERNSGAEVLAQCRVDCDVIVT